MVEFISLKNNFLSFTTKNKTTFKRLTSLNNYILNKYSKNNKSFITILNLQKIKKFFQNIKKKKQKMNQKKMSKCQKRISKMTQIIESINIYIYK